MESVNKTCIYFLTRVDFWKCYVVTVERLNREKFLSVSFSEKHNIRDQ